MDTNHLTSEEILQRYDLALQSSATAVWDWDIENDKIFWSSTSFEILDAGSPKDLPDTSADFFDKLLHPEDREAIRCAIRAHVKDREPFDLETRVMTMDGLPLWVHTRAQAEWNDLGRATRMYGTFHDISRLKKAEIKLAQKNEDLNSIVRLASHDLKSPLRAVSGFLEILRMACAEKLDAETLEYIEMAETAAKDMDSLIKAFVEYVRLEGRARNPGHFPVQECIETAIQRFLLDIEMKDIIITYNDMPGVEGFQTLITNLFISLIENTLFHGGDAQTITIRAGETESHYTFEYHDNGRGIPDKERAKAFQAFENRKEQKADDYKTAGAGLAVCKRVIELHHGEIWLADNQQDGFHLHFTIPKIMPKDDEVTA